MSQLPEFSGPAEIYYNKKESQNYNNNTRISKIQKAITERALQLLEVEVHNPLFLDIGCGSGLSGKVLSNNNYNWIGIDISNEMLQINNETTNNLGLIEFDIGESLPFKEDTFDYAISISAVQWLFQSYKKDHIPINRIKTFFKSLYKIISNKAILQFYCSKKETEILRQEASKAGFYGGSYIDNENTKNEKIFLILSKFKIDKNNEKNSRYNNRGERKGYFSKKGQRKF